MRACERSFYALAVFVTINRAPWFWFPAPACSTGAYQSQRACVKDPFTGKGYVRPPCSTLATGDPGDLCYTALGGPLVRLIRS